MHSSRLRATAAAVAVSTIVVASAITAAGPAFAVPADNIASFAATGSVQTWVVPDGVTEIGVEMAGAQGGHAYGGGGAGLRIGGSLPVTPGATLKIVVGGAGASGYQYSSGGGGGGGSFIYTAATQTGLLAAAGGGGGAGSNSFPTEATLGSAGANGTNNGGAGGIAGTGGQGSPSSSYSDTGGGGGLLTDGGNLGGGKSVVSGAAGGAGAMAGGFGGGGGSNGSAGGGGGGYSGGGGGNYGANGEAGGGGGGGSYLSGLVNVLALDQGGNGFVTITYPSVIGSVSALAGKSGDSLTLGGSGLAGATATIGGHAAAVTFSSDRQLVISVPFRLLPPSDAQDIIVTTAGGAVLTAPSAFTYAPVPTVTALSPSTGLLYGGETIEITGTGLDWLQGVYFGDEFASFIATSSSTISVTVPGSVVGSVDVTVVTLGGVSATSAATQYAYAAPTITLTPSTLPAGKQGAAYSQTLTASGAESGPYEFEVTDGTLPGGVSLASDGTISGTPTDSGSFGVTVLATSPDDYTGSAHYTIEIASSVPTVAGISPETGNAGESVTITGTDLDGAEVTIDGQLAQVDLAATNTATSLTVLVPTVEAGSEGKSVDVEVANTWGSAIETDAFTYLPPSLDLTVEFKMGDRVDGAKVALEVIGFASGQSVRAVAHSTPTTVYSAVTGANGALDATVTLPALEKGSHKLVVTAGSQERTVWFAVDGAGKITAVSTTGPVSNPADIIATTGADLDPALFAASGLLLAGLIAGAIALRGRRRQEAA